MDRANELRYLILAAQREGSRLFSEQIRPLGLTPAQAEVLAVIHEAQPLSLVEVGKRLVCESGSPSRLVDGLVKAKLIERIPSSTDQRKVSLTLTEHGESLYQQVAQIEQFFTHLVNSWGDQTTLDAVISALWQFVGDKSAGQALARRLQRDTP
ncbi:MAG TPA: MarR family transcriptional regulator [Ktedonobacteraceae bacterium]|nr:MarR family transcriptional regulator [Ktedonobacteraceae bacterium]